MAAIMSMIARAARAAATSHASSTAVDVVGGSRRITAFLPQRVLTGDAFGNGLSDVHRDDSTANLPSYTGRCDRLHRELDKVFLRMKKKTCFNVSEKEVESDEAIWDMYKRWCNHYKIVHDHGEMKRRFNIFMENARSVQLGDHRYGLHMFSDDAIFSSGTLPSDRN